MTIVYPHHSPSSLLEFSAAPAMWGLKKMLGWRQPVSAPMVRGTATEAGVAHGLMNPAASLADCVDIANAEYDTRMALSPDARTERYRSNLPDMISQALTELRPYGIPSRLQGNVEWQAEGLILPIIGFFDFEWADRGLIIDLKTTERMPTEIKISHARQVSLYAASDNYAAKLTYVTPKKTATYDLENIPAHRETLRQIALRVENVLELSNGDPEFFKTLFVPDLESFYWNEPAARQLAWEHWHI